MVEKGKIARMKSDAESSIALRAMNAKSEIPADVKVYLKYFLEKELSRMEGFTESIRRESDGGYIANELKISMYRINSILGNLDI